MTCYNTNFGYELNNFVSSRSKLNDVGERSLSAKFALYCLNNFHFACTLLDTSHVHDSAG